MCLLLAVGSELLFGLFSVFHFVSEQSVSEVVPQVFEVLEQTVYKEVDKFLSIDGVLSVTANLYVQLLLLLPVVNPTPLSHFSYLSLFCSALHGTQKINKTVLAECQR